MLVLASSVTRPVHAATIDHIELVCGLQMPCRLVKRLQVHDAEDKFKVEC